MNTTKDTAYVKLQWALPDGMVRTEYFDNATTDDINIVLELLAKLTIKDKN